MTLLRPQISATLALVLMIAAGPRVTLGQEPTKKDEALEKLLEKLDEPKPGTPGGVDPSKKPDAPRPTPAGEPGKKDDALEKLLEKLDGPKPGADQPTEAGKKDDGSKPAGGEVGAKDQSLDKLLEGLGGANDKPAPDDKKQGGGSGASDGPPPPPQGEGGDAKPDPLDAAQRQLDDLLEEKTGRTRKQPNKPGRQPGGGRGRGQGGGDDQDDAGPLGDLIKQMRDVENRLGKPDTGAETRQKQTEIVKNLDTLLEQVRNSSSQGQAMKLMRGGRNPGGPPKPGEGNQPGTTGQGVGLARPTPPKTPPVPTEVAKAIWGQLPPQFRDDMANIMNEKALPTKEDMIRLYYMSLGKKSATKGD